MGTAARWRWLYGGGGGGGRLPRWRGWLRGGRLSWRGGRLCGSRLSWRGGRLRGGSLLEGFRSFQSAERLSNRRNGRNGTRGGGRAWRRPRFARRRRRLRSGHGLAGWRRWLCCSSSGLAGWGRWAHNLLDSRLARWRRWPGCVRCSSRHGGRLSGFRWRTTFRGLLGLSLRHHLYFPRRHLLGRHRLRDRRQRPRCFVTQLLVQHLRHHGVAHLQEGAPAAWMPRAPS